MRDAFLGPVINEASVGALRGRPSARRAATARSRPAAGRPARPGHFVEPTVVTGLPQGHRLEREELFLPFVTVTRVGSFDEAIAEANAPVYGLTAGIFSEDDAEKERFLDRDRGRGGLREPARRRHDRRLARARRRSAAGSRAARPARAGSGPGTCRSSCASRAGRSSSELGRELREHLDVAVDRRRRRGPRSGSIPAHARASRTGHGSSNQSQTSSAELAVVPALVGR